MKNSTTSLYIYDFSTVIGFSSEKYGGSTWIVCGTQASNNFSNQADPKRREECARVIARILPGGCKCVDSVVGDI